MKRTETLQHFHHTIQARIHRLDFSALWPGFRPTRFALYDDKRACVDGQLMGKPAHFYGNTALAHEGETIAIWYLDKRSEARDIDALSASIVHEMFHAYQTACNDTRAPHEWKALALEPNADNLTRKHQENQALAALLDAPDVEAFMRFGRMRAHRQALHPQAFAYEAGIETHEGLAQYVEWRALEMLSASEARAQRREASSRLRHIDRLWPARHNHYDIGAAMAWVADALDVPFKHDLAGETRPLYAVIFDVAEPQECPVKPNASINALVQDANADAQARIDDVLNKPHHCQQGAFQLAGFDPFNTVKRGHYVHVNHIFAYTEGDDTRYIYGPSVIEVGDTMDIRAIYVPRKP